jgi:hypothetical protein
MMKNHKRRTLRLQDVIRIVSEFARNDREVSLAVADLMNRGYIRVRARNGTQRIVAF